MKKMTKIVKNFEITNIANLNEFLRSNDLIMMHVNIRGLNTNFNNLVTSEHIDF